jgi:Na+/melibiose symporter-like transporter
MNPPEPLYFREKTRAGPLSFAIKVFQGIGALPDTFKSFAFGTFLLFFYNQVLGLHALQASFAISAGLIIDAVFDPIIGSFSDNLRTRLGRRHSLMYLSALPLSIGLFLAFTPPAGLTETLLTAWLFGAVVLTNISMSLFIVPWTALYAEFSDDYRERTAIVTYRYAIGALGGLVFTFLTYRLAFPNSPAFPIGQLNPHGYKLFGPAVALAVFTSVFITTHLTRREIPFLLQPMAKTPRFSPMRVVRELASTLVNRDFLVLFIGSLLAAGIGGTSGALDIYTSTYFWGLTSNQLQWFGIIIFGALAAFGTVGVLQRWLDKKPLLVLCFALMVIDGIGMVCLRLLNVLPHNGQPALLAILVANSTVQAFLGTLLGIMFASMLADTLDAQELRTGRRQEGIFAAALAFSGKATGGVGALIGGFLLQEVIRWPVKADVHTLHAGLITRLGVIGGILVPLFYIAPLALGSQYKITREVHARIRAELEKRRAAAPRPSGDDDPAHLALDMALAPPSKTPLV